MDRENNKPHRKCFVLVFSNCFDGPYLFKFFKGCLPQILLDTFFNLCPIYNYIKNCIIQVKQIKQYSHLPRKPGRHCFMLALFLIEWLPHRLSVVWFLPFPEPILCSWAVCRFPASIENKLTCLGNAHKGNPRKMKKTHWTDNLHVKLQEIWT